LPDGSHYDPALFYNFMAGIKKFQRVDQRMAIRKPVDVKTVAAR
jgi:hypothetical protein